jgi:HSP20 family protein
MGELSVRREAPIAPIRREWDPFHAMRSLLDWDPFREVAPAMMPNRLSEFDPAFELKEVPTGFALRADMPGVKEQDLEVNITGNRLSVKGKRESESKEEKEGGTFYVYERSYGSFSRTFTLPAEIDATKVRAELKDGVLMIELPKRPEAQAQKIPIKGAAPKS